MQLFRPLGLSMRLVRILFLPLVLWLSACTVSLTPDFDPALHGGLDDANKQALTLFSAVEGGSPAASFPRLEDRYHAVIGAFGALKARAETRPEPVLGQRFAARVARVPGMAGLCEGVEDGKSCAWVTPRAIGEAIETLSKMRDRHRERGLGAGVVAALKGNYEIAVEQALTVEGALK